MPVETKSERHTCVKGKPFRVASVQAFTETLAIPSQQFSQIAIGNSTKRAHINSALLGAITALIRLGTEVFITDARPGKQNFPDNAERDIVDRNRFDLRQLVDGGQLCLNEAPKDSFSHRSL